MHRDVYIMRIAKILRTLLNHKIENQKISPAKSDYCQDKTMTLQNYNFIRFFIKFAIAKLDFAITCLDSFGSSPLEPTVRLCI